MARKRIHDLGELVEGAVEALTSALSDGDEKHEPGSWKEEDIETQLDHIDEHFNAITSGDVAEDHYSHLICRAVMLYIKNRDEITS